MPDVRPKGQDMACHGLVYDSPAPPASRPNHQPAPTYLQEMTGDQLRELERNKRKAFWALANLHPGDPNASELLIVLDNLDALERDIRPSTDKALESSEVRDVVSVKRHNSGIDIVLELDIPQSWRERCKRPGKPPTSCRALGCSALFHPYRSS